MSLQQSKPPKDSPYQPGLLDSLRPDYCAHDPALDAIACDICSGYSQSRFRLRQIRDEYRKRTRPAHKVWREVPCGCASVIADVERGGDTDSEVYCTSCGGTGRYLQPVRFEAEKEALAFTIKERGPYDGMGRCQFLLAWRQHDREREQVYFAWPEKTAAELRLRGHFVEIE